MALAASLPVPMDQPPASYPATPLAEGRGARVLLEIDVAETGAVLSVRVLEPVGEGFDEAAVEAVRRMRFTPATDDAGVPVAARIQYAYLFVAERAAPRSLEGTVRNAAGPVAGISVRVVPPSTPPFDLTTDSSGTFSAAGLVPGTYQVGVAGTATTVEVREGAVAIASLTLVEPGAVDQTVEVVDDNATPEVTERTLSPEEVRFLPGTGGDVVKVVQNLPGVARAPLGVGQLIIRGTSPEDSAFFLDSSPIPIVFHFSGLSTVLNGDFIEEVAYLPGNYGVRYGRALGGIVDLRTRAGLPEESGGYVSLDLYQGTAFVEQRIGKRTAIEASLRRSWIDAVLTPILSTSATTVRAPQYWDAQARVVHSLDSGGTVEVLGLFSADRFRVVGEEDGSVAIGLSTTFGKARAR